MSKEVIFAGILALACLALVGVAFLAPHSPKRTEPVKTETAETVVPEGETTSGSMSAPTSSTTTGGSATSSLVAQGTTGSGSFTAGSGSFTSATGTTTGGGYTTAGGYTGTGTTAGGYTGTGTTPGGYTGAGTTTTGSAFTGGKTTGTFTAGGATGGLSPHTAIPVGPAPETSPLTANEKTHTVAANETLAEISQKYYNSSKYWKKIAEANKVDPNALKVGQKLIIPALTAEPAPVGAPIVAAAPGEGSYTVQKGDSYYVIAQKQLGSASRWKEIQKLNGIGPEELHVGQVIKLPGKDSATAAPTPVTGGTEPPPGAKVHVVAAGETLSDISSKEYGTSTRWKDILKANPGVSPEGLKVGQKLIIPDAPATPNVPASANPASTGSGVGQYTVKPGDDLQKIAEKELGSKNAWRRIADANPGLDPRKLRAGQVIKIPGKSGTSDDTRPAPAPLGGTSGTNGTGTAFGTTGGTSPFGTTGRATAGATTAGTTSGGFTATTGGTTGAHPGDHVGPP